MIYNKNFPFIISFLDLINEELQQVNPMYKLSNRQKRWIGFCILGVLVTGTFCWTKFERYSLGKFTVASLSWVFRRARIFWSYLLVASVRVILKKYSITGGSLVIDDTDRMRSKSTTAIGKVHKIFDKKTGGYFMGQNIVFLLLVTDKVTIPVGFKFYQPDPVKVAWNQQDDKLRHAKVPKSKRPKPPENNPEFPTKIQIALELIREFKQYFSEISVTSISTDAAYGSSFFFQQAAEVYPGTQIISQLKRTQNAYYQGTYKPVEQIFSGITAIQQAITIRGKQQKVSIKSARLKVQAHNQVQMIVALMYEGEKEYRYIVAQELSWSAITIVKAYGLRWLVEVFIEDWKGNEGWGQLALQQGDEVSCRGVIVSLLVDLCLLFHPNQFARLKNKQTACTVGSLREQIKNESLLATFHDILLSQNPLQAFAELKDKFSDFFLLRDSSKHMVNNDLSDLKPSPSLTKVFGKLKVCEV
jgi:hypothetical protein